MSKARWHLGTDPEYFLMNAAGQPVSAHTVFPEKSTKLVHPTSKGTKLFRDGYALELNVEASPCFDRLHLQVEEALGYARQLCAPHGLTPVYVPTVEVDLNFLATAPEDLHFFGCDPSYDAYDETMKKPSVDARTHPYRYAGGHMHISLDKESITTPAFGNPYSWVIDWESICKFIKMADQYVGLPLCKWFGSLDMYRRRAVYGQAGEFRPQVYPGQKFLGVEYRTPGPELWSNREVARISFASYRTLADNFHAFSATWDSGREAAIRHAVNTGEGVDSLLVDIPGVATVAELNAFNPLQRQAA